MIAKFKRPFHDFVKKQPIAFQMVIQDEVDTICSDYTVGEQKTGDLTAFWVHKFKFKKQHYLIAYRASPVGKAEGRSIDILMIDFFQIGSHENFYATLKKYLKS